MMKEKKLSWEELEAKAIYTPEIEDEEIEETKNNKKTKISLRQRQSTPKIHTKKEQKTKNILFEVIDQELLNKSGGIVQGMSGSTIIQGEYIIGAVTHVVVDNPKKGYGILIVNMLEEAEN